MYYNYYVRNFQKSAGNRNPPPDYKKALLRGLLTTGMSTLGGAGLGYIASLLSKGNIDRGDAIRSGALTGLSLGAGEELLRAGSNYLSDKLKWMPPPKNSGNTSKPPADAADDDDDDNFSRRAFYFAKNDYSPWVDRLNARMKQINKLHPGAINDLDSAYDSYLDASRNSPGFFGKIKNFITGVEDPADKYKALIDNRKKWVGALKSDREKIQSALSVLGSDSITNESGDTVDVTDDMREAALDRLRGSGGLEISQSELNRKLPKYLDPMFSDQGPSPFAEFRRNVWNTAKKKFLEKFSRDPRLAAIDFARKHAAACAYGVNFSSSAPYGYFYY